MKQPSRVDQIRALREARYERNQALMREQEARDAARASAQASPTQSRVKAGKKKKACKKGRKRA